MSLDAVNVSVPSVGHYLLGKTDVLSRVGTAASECTALAVKQCIHDVISHQARARPNAPALCAWDGELTYGELDDLSSRLAGHIAGLGVGPEVVVPLCFEKSLWTTVAMLGVLKAGGAFVLLDPGLPERRLEKLCQQMHATIAITSTQCKG
ncbi:AMP-binding enzyme [Hirsutella rhossiliensis]